MISDADELRAYKKKHNFFETPPKILTEIVKLLSGVGSDANILEPSAGRGAIANAITYSLKYDVNIYCVEPQHEFHELLSEYELFKGKFEDLRTSMEFDAVVMNPPYKDNMALIHTNRAWYHLKPGGRLITLVDEKTARIIDMEFMGFVFERIEFRKAFKETSIRTVLFLIHKPLYEK